VPAPVPAGADLKRAGTIVYVGTVPYTPDPERYDRMEYRRCGRSGLKLPLVSLGLWQNFGDARRPEEVDSMMTRAFDLGVTHFDLANNYGPPYGAAETSAGRVLNGSLAPHRDELVISTKAGYDMWDGPYGDGGSRKYLLTSLEASLDRLGLDHVDIFYSHRFDPETPLEETMGALDTAVRQGKALYVGISSYPPEQTEAAAEILDRLGTRLLIHQPPYSMFNRWIEHGLLDTFASRWAASSSRRCPRGCSPTGIWTGCPPAHGQVSPGRSTKASSTSRSSTRCGRSMTWPRDAARPWHRWLWPGRCAIPGSPPP
jgi:L-glyceraldehyde 3-phosphate reductase